MIWMLWQLCLVIDAGPQLLASAQASMKDLWYSRRQCLKSLLMDGEGIGRWGRMLFTSSRPIPSSRGGVISRLMPGP